MDAHRRQRLSAVLEAEGPDALVATTTENVYYVSGLRSISHALFRGLELYAVFTRRGTALVIPFIDTTGVAADRIEVDHVACYGKFFFEYADDPGEIGRKIREWTRAPAASPADALAGVLGDLGVFGRRVGLDEGNLFAPTWKRVEDRLAGTTLVPASQMFRQARMVNGPDEVAAVERAALVARDGDTAVLALPKPGVDERATIATMKPDMPMNQVFDLTIRITREHGMPHYQRHHVGHGIGLEPYDPPTINATTNTALEAGMVFCVETPYYEHGWGGVQVEDAVEVTPTGVRTLTRSSQDLAVV